MEKKDSGPDGARTCEVAGVKLRIGDMWDEVHKLRKQVEVLQQQVSGLLGLKESITLLSKNQLCQQPAQAAQSNADRERLRSEASQSSSDALQAMHSFQEVVAGQQAEISSVWKAVRCQRDEIAHFRQSSTALQAVKTEAWSVWEAVRRQRQDIGSLQQTSATLKEELKALTAAVEADASQRSDSAHLRQRAATSGAVNQDITHLRQSATALDAVKSETWGVWEAVRRQRQDISSLHQISARLQEESTTLTATMEAEASQRREFQGIALEQRKQQANLLDGQAQQLEGIALEQRKQQADLDGKALQLEERLRQIESCVLPSFVSFAGGIEPERSSQRSPLQHSPLLRSPLLQPAVQASSPVKELHLSSMSPDRASPSRRLPGASPAFRHLDLHDLPPYASSVRCERLHVQEPEGLRCDMDTSHCMRLDFQEVDAKPRPAHAGLSSEGPDAREQEMQDWKEVSLFAQSVRVALLELSGTVSDLTVSSNELRVRQDLMELGLLHVQETSARWRDRRVLRSELVDLGFIPGGFCRGDTVFADRDGQRNAEFWRQLQRDYSCAPLRVEGAAEDPGKVQLACPAYGTDLVVDFRRLTKSRGGELSTAAIHP